MRERTRSNRSVYEGGSGEEKDNTQRRFGGTPDSHSRMLSSSERTLDTDGENENKRE